MRVGQSEAVVVAGRESLSPPAGDRGVLSAPACESAVAPVAPLGAPRPAPPGDIPLRHPSERSDDPMRRRDYTHTPRPEGGYRKPDLEGLFDETTPPPQIRRRRGDLAGPRVGARRKPRRSAQDVPSRGL